MKSSIISFLLLQMICTWGCSTNAEVPGSNSSSIFYVDNKKGNDNNPGSIEKPFHSLDKALEVVAGRVKEGIRSDKIYLRGGRYKKISTQTLYRLELKGTQDDFAELSAMPCDSTAPGAVKRKSGKWYENVVIDDGFEIKTKWEKVAGDKNIWKTSPGYTNLEWTHQNIWPWKRTPKGFPYSDKDDTPNTTSFTVAPYMLMQDGEPFIWVDYTDSITGPGLRTYDHQTGELFIWPMGDKDPNTCKIESWYGGPEEDETGAPYEIGTLHLDGEGRALFDGNMEYATIRGLEFYLFNKIFEFHRRKYKNEAERVIQRNVLIEDNLFSYGWMQILLDGNTVNFPEKGVLLPRYQDRSDWTARNNVFFRPSRECFQLHGDNHIFEFNDVIEHIGPWGGPAACVSVCNTRNTRNAIIRNNYIVGHGRNNKYRHSAVFMIEVAGGFHQTSEGDYIFGGQTFENNIIADFTGTAMVLGKGGGTRMRNITVRNNIFKDGVDPAVAISSPQLNLVIDNNIFYNLKSAISIPAKNYVPEYRSKPSAFSIRNNIFVKNKQAIDPNLLIPGDNSNIYVENNQFYQNDQAPVGEKPVVKDPLFRSVDNLDFRPAEGNRKEIRNNYYGPYPQNGAFVRGTDWWNFN